MKFTILGNAEVTQKSPTMIRVEKYLRSLPDGRLLNSVALVAAMQLNFGNFRSAIRAYIAPELVTRSPKGTAKLYGNPKTVCAWKKQHQL